MDASMNLADYYFPMLNSLSSKAKLYLVRKLTDSLLKDKSMSTQSVEEERLAAFRKLAGAWADDPEGEAMEREIRDGRTSNKTREIISFDE